jgi:hypothetical protein
MSTSTAAHMSAAAHVSAAEAAAAKTAAKAAAAKAAHGCAAEPASETSTRISPHAAHWRSPEATAQAAHRRARSNPRTAVNGSTIHSAAGHGHSTTRGRAWHSSPSHPAHGSIR